MRQKSERLKSLIPTGIDKDLSEKMRIVYTDGGIDRLRADLLKYLEREIAIERLKEIYTNLSRVFSAAKRLLDPERPRIEGMKAAQMNQLRQVHEFVEQTVEKFSDHVRNIEEGLKGASGKLLDAAKEKIGKEVDGMIKGLNFGRIRAKLQIPAPTASRPRRSRCSRKNSRTSSPRSSSSTPCGDLGRGLQDPRGGQDREDTRGLASSLDRNFSDDYKKIIGEFSLNINESTRMRAKEETWAILDADIRPTGFEPEWTSRSRRNSAASCRPSSPGVLQYADKLKSILWRYYKGILDVLIEKFEGLMAELTESLKASRTSACPSTCSRRGRGLRGAEEGLQGPRVLQAVQPDRKNHERRGGAVRRSRVK